MPRRSNDFQRLILHVESQLAPHGATITESYEPYDELAETKREIDILIEYPVGPRVLRTGIECRDHKRKGGLPWIEQAYQAHRHFKIDRTVLVCRAGFTVPAQRKARRLGVELLTLEQAQFSDWERVIGTSRVAIQVLQNLSVTGIMVDAPGLAGSQGELIPLGDALLVDGATGLVESIAQFALELIETHNLRDQIFERFPEMFTYSAPVADLMVVPRTPLFVVLSGSQYSVDALMLEITPNIARTEVRLAAYSYAGTEIAYGGGEIDGVPFAVYANMLPGTRQYDVHFAFPTELRKKLDIESLRAAIETFGTQRMASAKAG